MCYEALRNGDATERPVGAVLRAELRDAVVNGLAAAVLVAVGLLGRGFGPATVLPFALAGLGLGVVVHQAVLVAGVAVQRVRQPAVDGGDAAA